MKHIVLVEEPNKEKPYYTQVYVAGENQTPSGHKVSFVEFIDPKGTLRQYLPDLEVYSISLPWLSCQIYGMVVATLHEGTGVHVTVREIIGKAIWTGVTGEVKEYHFRCAAGHEFSVLMKDTIEIDEIADCPALTCIYSAHLLGENDAEVSKDPTDLLCH